MRTIPVQKSINVCHEVMAYERADELVRGNTSFAVANCICRQAMRVVGRGCDKPEESCLVLGPVANYIVQRDRGRRISLTETLEILERADRTGLVLQPDNAKDPLFICMCCGCCCGILRAIKRAPKPAKIVSSPFIANLDAKHCNNCGLCTQRCQMDAISHCDETVALDDDRCIGCGLCVSTCPTESLTLVRKPASEQAEIPENHTRSVINVGRARGKLGVREMIRLQVKSKLDRLVAPN